VPSYIETQFPIARLSAESYKERKANNGQTLTRLGKWWGRKPLILVRASILGMLMPASANPHRDREIFLKLLTMDEDGLLRRWNKPFTTAELGVLATPAERERWSDLDGALEEAKEHVKTLRLASARVSRSDRDAKSAAIAAINAAVAVVDQRATELYTYLDRVRRAAFLRLPHVEQLDRCLRPEHLDGPSPEAWAEINAHLGTTAASLPQLVEQLGQRTFGHTPRVGDAFCGGGSIPFEAARIGCNAFGADLNPVAGLLTWASLNLLGGSKSLQECVMRTQAHAFSAADQQVTAWGIEQNDLGERADAYLYCVEVKPEGCAYYIPLASSWLVGEKSQVIVRWHQQAGSDRLRPEVAYVDADTVARYKAGFGATYVSERVIDPFDANRSWSIESLRGPDGLRRWSNDDVMHRENDTYHERLYCIRWVKTTVRDDDKIQEIRRYAAPDSSDLAREEKVLKLLRERFVNWQSQGYVPSNTIPPGAETDRLDRERGWSHWHHLFTPRQLLTHGLLAEKSSELAKTQSEIAYGLLGIANLANWNSRLSCWLPQKTNEKGNNTFYNQSLNTFFNYSVRPMIKIGPTWEIFDEALDAQPFGNSLIEVSDARDLRVICDLWITDPPYADAVNYHELGDFFLSWYDKQLAKTFPNWSADARAELAVRGDGDDFRRSMVEIYRNLARHMPDNGLQMVQFTHQDPAVWADLGMILWAAGLKATAAWTISTESDAGGFKVGNYVQGTVCLVLRKRITAEAGFLDEIFPLVEDEVKRQINSMQALDEGGEPNFNDADYQLAAYAAALKVLTQYGTIDGRDVEHEVFAVRERGQKSDFQSVIERALRIACDYLVPRGLDAAWRELSLDERYYLRALDIESRGERRKGMYEELARGFGVTDIKPLLKADKANGASMHTPSGFEATLLAAPGGAAPVAGALPARRGRAGAGAPHPFASSSLRHLLFAIRETVAANNDPANGRQYLHDTYGPSVYWQHRERFLALLEWLANLGNTAGMDAWATDSAAARLLAGRLRNDQA
jgi:putative DNA methylase